jgi:hypothetical protein
MVLALERFNHRCQIRAFPSGKLAWLFLIDQLLAVA